ncbi:DUF4055 domain-containing protein [Sphingomonas melonis]
MTISSDAIDALDPKIAEYHAYWARNRQLVAGSRVVTANASLYLTKSRDMDNDDFAQYAKRVPFYSAASRTHDGLMGLMLRAAPKVEAPDKLSDILETITAQGFTIEDLAEELASERLITNFTGLVTDYPATPAGLTAQQAIDGGYRPFVAVYRAESILGIETGVVGNRKRVVRVRLLDTPDQVRELRLDDGVYTITIHRRGNSGWVADAPIVPMRAGEVMDEIPFTLDSTSRNFLPVNAPLGEICALNVYHYVASADLATERYYSTVRIFTTYGLDPEAAKNLPVYPGVKWDILKSKNDAAVEIVSASDNTISDLRQAVQDIEKQMATVGARILESEQPANVAAETTRIRDNSANASLAAIVRRGDRTINDQLRWVAYWMGYDEDGTITYETPTDFSAQPLDAQAITSRMQMWQAGAISRDTFLDMMIEAGVLAETFDREADAAKVEAEMIDRPTQIIDPKSQIDPKATA